jgi:hypothetical protein
MPSKRAKISWGGGYPEKNDQGLVDLVMELREYMDGRLGGEVEKVKKVGRKEIEGIERG